MSTNESLVILHVEGNPDHARLVARSLRRHLARNTLYHDDMIEQMGFYWLGCNRCFASSGGRRRGGRLQSTLGEGTL